MTTTYTTDSVRINHSKRALEVTKDFYKRTLIFGTSEYNELTQAKKAFPTYRVSFKSAPKKKFEDKVNTKDMMLYIKNHSGKDSAQMKAFLELRGTTVKDAGNRVDAVESADLTTMREWFFMTYPELANKTEKRQNRINEILAEAARNAASA
jgi:hypothetical protein